MKIAIPSSDKTKVAEHFGRARYFAIYDTDDKTFVYHDNETNLHAAQGAGIQSASFLINQNVSIVISPSIGPKAYSTMEKDIKMYHLTDKDFSLEQALEKYLAGEIQKMEGFVH